jgi:ubiquinone/menaquinone biosynthesis C-methylase UbiE
MGIINDFISQFGKPVGFWGDVAGAIMAWRPSNRERNAYVIDLLDSKSDDRVLEIGFGPGAAIRELSKIVINGKIVGIDHSESMMRMAAGRNAIAIDADRVELLCTSVERLPPFAEPFDKIFAINSYQFWPDPVGNLKQLREVLKPGGVIAIAEQPRSRSATDETADRIGRKIVRDLEMAGFSRVGLERKLMKPVNTVCGIGVK